MLRTAHLLGFALFGLAAVIGCTTLSGSSDDGDGDNKGSGEPCAVHSDCGEGQICEDQRCQANTKGGPCDTSRQCVASETCVGGVCGCGGDQFTADRVPVNILIVLDRSGSMQCNLGDDEVEPDDPGSRWQNARRALEQLFATYDDQIRFGLSVFPSPDADEPREGAVCVGTPGCVDDDDRNCLGPKRVVGLGAGAGADILAAIDSGANNPGGCTPSGPALQDAVSNPGLKDPNAENFVLFITDGEQACGSLTQLQAIQSLRAETPEIRTFVVGFTGQVNQGELNQAAREGGMERPSEPYYYQANDEATLAAALAEIGGRAASCTYTLDEAPPNIDDLQVLVDGASVPRDSSKQEGWDYDPATNQVTFYGAVCDSLKAGDAGEVAIVFDCSIIVE